MNGIAHETNLESYTLSVSVNGLSGGHLFPRLFLADSISFARPYRLVAAHLSTAFGFASPLQVIGFALIIGTRQPFVVLNNEVQTILSHWQGPCAVLDAVNNSPATWGYFHDFEVMIPPGEVLALYGVMGPIAEGAFIVCTACCHVQPA